MFIYYFVFHVLNKYVSKCKHPNWLWDTSSFKSIIGVERLRRETEHSLPFNVEEWVAIYLHRKL